MRRLVALLCGVALGAVSLTVGPATAVYESDDAGQMPSTAQVVYATTISGSLGTHADVDMYQITINNASAFSASTSGSATFDTMLMLFDSAGHVVELNDDITGTVNQSTLWPGSSGNPYAPQTTGTYYLAISGYDLLPYTSTGTQMTYDYPVAYWYDPVSGYEAYGPVDSSYVLDHWVDPEAGTAYGTYKITLTGVAATVDVGSTIDLGWAGTGVYGEAVAVDGNWAVGEANVGEVVHAFASDLSASPPTVVDLGTLGGSESGARDVGGNWVVGWSNATNGEQHAFAKDLSTTTPQLIDLNPAGMSWGKVNAIDGRWAVGEIDETPPADRWWGAAWDLTSATVATPPEPIKLAPLPTDPWAWAEHVSGDRAVGFSQNASGEQVQTIVAWQLSGASTATAVPAVELPPLPGGTAVLQAVSGHWAVGYSDTASDTVHDSAVVWDLDETSPTAIALPKTLLEARAFAMDGDWVVGMDADSGVRYPVAWDLSSFPPTEKVLPNIGSPGVEFGAALAIDGDWVVGASQHPTSFHAFAYNLATDGPMLDLGNLGGDAAALAVAGTWAVGRSNPSTSDGVLSHPAAWNLLAPSRPTMGVPTAGDTTVTLTWAAPAYTAGAPVTGYTLAYKATSATAWTTASPSPATATWMTVDSLTNAWTYQFKVRATTANGDSAYSTEVTATPATVPSTPGAPTAKRARTGMSLTWTDNGNGGAAITNHQVEVYTYTKATRRTPESYTYVRTDTTDSSSTTYIVTGLTKNVSYRFRVAAGNSTGYSSFSEYSNTARG